MRGSLLTDTGAYVQYMEVSGTYSCQWPFYKEWNDSIVFDRPQGCHLVTLLTMLTLLGFTLLPPHYLSPSLAQAVVYSKTQEHLNYYSMLDLLSDYVSTVHCRSHQESWIEWHQKAISVLCLGVVRFTCNPTTTMIMFGFAHTKWPKRQKSWGNLGGEGHWVFN